jgi:Lipase (class 3)
LQNSVVVFSSKNGFLKIQNGYKGGIVLRDVTQPVYGENSHDSHSNERYDRKGLQDESIQYQQNMLNQRECYYLYYEMKPNGMILQQIFCRGTTLWDDMITCLQCWMVYDDDCQCYIHKGFRNHAERILRDVIPLLIDPTLSSSRATIEVCGHSLGGAVATILSIKLRRLGYNVVRLTTVGEPRYVFRRQHNTTMNENPDDHLLLLLPKHHVRIEHEYDFVTYLPPFGTKIDTTTIYITSKHGVRFISDHSSISSRCQDDAVKRMVPITWTNESLFWNFLLPEMIMSKGIQHRIPSYVNSLKSSVTTSR